MILTTTTQKLKVKLATTVAANQSPVIVDYVDLTTTSTTPGMTASTTNNTTFVDILAAPASSTQRKVNSINIRNADTSSISVTIVFDNNSTEYELLKWRHKRICYS